MVCSFFQGKWGLAAMGTTIKCTANSCGDAAVTVFAQRELCVSHFVSLCYEELERLGRKGRSPKQNVSELAALKLFVTECSRRALEVSLSCKNLDNLQRGRLLDILLWAGELYPVEVPAQEWRFAQSA
jgi:hypothetical protein